MSDMNDYYRLNIPNGEVKRILDSDNRVLWRRAIEKSTDESSFEGTRNTALKALSRYGKCVQNGTPTPDAPVDIVCNNGAVRFGALGQNLLNPVGVTIGQNYTPEGKPNSSQNNWRTGLIPIEGGKTYAFWGRRKSDNAISAFNRINWFDADGNNISPRPSYTVDTVTVGTAPSNAAFVGLSCSCYNSSAAISQATFDEFNWMLAETDAEIPYEPFVGGIYTDGTPEVLTVGKNLFSQDSYLDAYCSAGGTITAHNSSRCFVMECKPNTEYRFIFDNSAISSPRCVINGFAAQPEIRMRSTQVCYSSSNTSPMLHDTTFTTDADVHYLVMWLMYQKSDDDTKAAVNKAILMETATAQTASVANLFAVGDYKDEVDVISGTVTRRVGVKVLDGTEANWLANSANGIWMLRLWDKRIGSAMALTSTHFAGTNAGTASMPNNSIKFYNSMAFNYNGTVFIKATAYSTLDDFKAYLAAQYAAGTPVVVMYPLAEETTEQVAGQPLRTTAGTNVVSVTSNVDPVTLVVKYVGE